MNSWSRLYKPALLLLTLLLFLGSGQFQARMNTDRKAMGLTKLDPLQNAPPMLAFTTVALGGFRGLIANLLWMRLNDLQLDDKYFEMVQLCDWIMKLQPHMVAVWQFQAWNMAYNISVKFKDHEDRWHWVKRGFELLRDQGIPLNPNETKLYRDLSWIFQHKIGANLDDAHMLYKLRWAQEMQGVTGGRPDFKELENPTTPEFKEKARTLREIYKMDPKLMEQVDEDYGPFDWRLPDAYAVYWAEAGRLKARPEDQETVRRSIYQSLQQMAFRGGSLDKSVTNVTEQNFRLWPNLDQIPVINAAYEKMLALGTNDENGVQKSSETGHKNFVKQAIVLLFEDGREQKAQYWYNYLKNRYTNAFVGKEAHMSMEDYAISQITEDNSETDQNKVTASILGMFDHSFVCMIQDNDDQAENYRNMAIRIWKHYNQRITGANGNDKRVGLKSLQELRQMVLDRDLDPNTGFPPWARAKLRTELGLPGEPPPAPAASASAGP